MADKDGRVENWEAIFYPDSLPYDWIEICRSWRIPFLVSPLHDRDLERDGVTFKKAHYHVIFKFGSKKSFKQVFDMIAPLGQNMIMDIKDIRGAVRYQVHIDDPDKAQYSIDDMRSFCGFDFKLYFALSIYDKDRILDNIFDLIESQNIKSYRGLILFLKDNIDDFVYRNVAMHNSHAIRTYLFDKRDGI